MMEYRGARIQVLDLPGIIKGASSGRGLGKRILSVARSADLVLLVLDVFQPYHRDVLVQELGNMGIRLNTLPPNLTIEKAGSGGIAVARLVGPTRHHQQAYPGHAAPVRDNECPGRRTGGMSPQSSWQTTWRATPCMPRPSPS